MFTRNFSCSVLLFLPRVFRISSTRLLLSVARLSSLFFYLSNSLVAVWAVSRSLAATWEIEFSFFSSGYLDVSVHPVSLPYPMNSDKGAWSFSKRVSPFGDLGIFA